MTIRRRHVLLSSVAALGMAAVRAAAQGSGKEHEHAQAPTAAAPGTAQRTAGSRDAYLYIGWPQNGDTVTSPFKVWFGLRNFGVAPAGVAKPLTGHHHLLIDVDPPPFDEPIPSDRNHPHFGLGQTETRLELPPGRHTLQLLLGDENHVPHDPPLLSRRITVTILP
jgi:Domain of unknown function (DUF4399)